MLFYLCFCAARWPADLFKSKVGLYRGLRKGKLIETDKVAGEAYYSGMEIFEVYFIIW